MAFRKLLPRPFVLAAVLGAVAFPSVAKADELATCVKASEQAQSLKDESKYKKAREQLLICTRDVCPAVVKKDCVQWLQEVDGSMPSVVISAKDGKGQDLTAVKVFVDDQPLIETLDGKPQALDPGAHTFRYEQAGSAPLEEKVVLGAGEKNRVIKVQFPNADGTPPGPAPIPVVVPPPVEPLPGGGGSPKPPIAAYVIGGIGVVAIGSFAFFGLTGKSDVSTLRDGCGVTKMCAQSDVDAAHTKLVIADVSLAVGVVALGVATYMILTNKSPVEAKIAPPAAKNFFTAPRFDFHAMPGGGVAELGARF